MGNNNTKSTIIYDFDNIKNNYASLKIEIEELKNQVDSMCNLIVDLENQLKDFSTVLNEYVNGNCSYHEVPVNSLELNSYFVALSVNETYQLTASVNPIDASNKTIIWTSSDENIAKVSSVGLVTYLNEGIATINAACGEISVNCLIKKKVITDNEYLNLLDVTTLWNKGITGIGVKVAVIEGGIISLPDKLKIKGWLNTITNTYTETSPSSGDSNWYISTHGFSTAGIISGRDTGIAPDCELYSVIVKTDISNIDDILVNVKAGIKWCLSNDIDIINMSIEILNVDYELISLAKEAAAKNVIITCSFGNSGINSGNLFACNDATISAGAINKDKSLCDFSNYGEGMSFVAFGDAMPSYDNNGNIIVYSGTSCSVAIISGLVALLKQQNKKLRFKEIEYLLMDSCEDLGDTGKDDKFGYGMPKAYKIPENYKTYEEIETIEKNIAINDMVIYMPQTIKIGDIYKPIVRIVPRILNNQNIFISSLDEAVLSVNQLTNEIKANKGGISSLSFSVQGREYVKKIEIHILSDLEAQVQSILKNYNISKVTNGGFTGKGIKVAILDAGVNIVGNIDSVIYGPNYIAFNPTTSNSDDYGQGTITASIVKSIAPDCILYSVKNQNGGGYSYNNEILQDASLQWCIDNKMDIIIARNLLLGVYESKNILFKKMNEAGIITIVKQCSGDAIDKFSASNTEDNLCVVMLNSDNTPFVTDQTDNLDVSAYYVGFPAYSNTGQIIVTSTQNMGASLGVVGGICALLKQQKPSMNVTKLRELLPTICTNLGPIKKFGYGILKADIL
ncbi:S8 family serine peptidase [Clostridium saccharoperbutylacetonicum]